MPQNITRATTLMLLTLATVGAVDAKPTLVGQAYDIVTTMSDGIERGKMDKKERVKTETCTWTFTAGSIAVAGSEGHKENVPYKVTWVGRTAQVTVDIPEKGAKLDVVIDGKGLRGKWVLDPRMLAAFTKPPTIALTGTLRSIPVDLGSALAKANELQLQRKPKEAASIFAKIIEERTTELELSLPALTGYVACCQLLKDDATVSKDYAALAKKFGVTLPPLDGVAALDVQRASEDLLWGQIGDGEDLKWVVKEAKWSTVDGKDGKQQR
ncbi:MAG: hypothetical protein AAB263_13810, partial [Planctomycetota bacterium]